MKGRVESAVAIVGRVVLDIYVDPDAGIPSPGDMGHCRLAYRIGGTAANTAVDLVALGVPVKLYGLVGSDLFGDWLADELRLHGIEVEGLRIAERAPTSVSLVFRDDSGECALLNQPGANEYLAPPSVDWKSEGVALVHIGGLLSLPGIEDASIRWLQQLKSHCKLSADTQRNVERAWTIEKFLPLLDFIFVNQMEGEAITREREPINIVHRLLAMGSRHAVVKVGAEGCFVGDSSETFQSAGFPVSAIDTTGAGDAFVAGFLAGFIEDLTLEECAKLANAAGASVVERQGATEGIKRARDIFGRSVRQNKKA